MTTRPGLRRVLALVASIPLSIVPVAAPTGAAGTPARVAAARPTGGYWLLAADGGVFAFGAAAFHGPAGNRGADVAGMAATAAGDGYWLADDDGDVFPVGAAGHFGSRPGETDDIAAFAARPRGDGYWMATRTGSVEAYGSAPYLGEAVVKRSHRIVAMTPTPSGNGYWLGALDGGVFSFGDARFHGSVGGTRLNQPIVGMATTPTGAGYWLVASDGGIFAFGDARFFGSTGAMKLNRPIVGMAATPSGAGYWLVASDGGIFTFGDAGFFGSMGATPLNRPIVGMAAVQAGVPGAPAAIVTVPSPAPLPGGPVPPVHLPPLPPSNPPVPGVPAPPDTGGIRSVGGTTAATAKGARSLTLAVPGGYRPGDVLLATLQSDYGIVDHTPPPGWTLVAYREERLTDLTGYVFSKVAGAEEPAAYTWQGAALSDKTIIGGTMVAFRGVDKASPVADSRINNETADATQMLCPSADAPAGGMLVCLFTHDDAVAFSPPPGMTGVSSFILPTDGRDDRHATTYELIRTAGPTGPRVATIAGGGGGNDLAIAVVLKPAS
jgi:hypothetical protein